MKLKTLKDLRERKIGFVCERELKAEAVKIAKARGLDRIDHTDLCELHMDDWIEFFNITEEDLK